MNNEIKEILEQLECYRKIGKKDVYYPECVLPNKKAFILLDYITNLQTIERQYSAILSENAELQQEIEKLNDDKRGMLIQLYKANDNRDKVKQENDNLINLVKEFENKGYDIGQERADFLLEIKDLQQENEIRQQDINNLTYQLAKMKEENERLKENNQNMQEEMARTWQKCDDYKSRCEKAIEYIKNDWYELNTRDIEHCINLGKDIRIDLLNILQNGSDDNE